MRKKYKKLVRNYHGILSKRYRFEHKIYYVQENITYEDNMSIDKCFTNLPGVIKEGQRCDVFECLFGMRTIQVQIYFYTLKSSRSILEIADYIDRDRTTALRLTNDLIKKRLMHKKTEKLEKGGIRYIYSSVPENEVKELLLDALEDMKEALKYFIGLDWEKLEMEIESEIEV